LGVEGITLQDLPVVKDALREGLSRGVRAKIGSESERFVNGEESFHVLERTGAAIFFSDDLSTTPVEHAVDATDHGAGALDLDEIDWFHHSRFGGQLAGIEAASSGGNDLSSSSMDGVGVKGDVEHLVSDAAHVLFAEDSFFGGPLEGGDARVLDLVQILNSFGGVIENVGASSVGAKAPDLSGIGGFPVVVDKSSPKKIVALALSRT